MPSDNKSPQMQTDVIVWSGQLVSAIGSYITQFATTFWAWQLTGNVTALTLIVFSSQATSFLVAPFAGAIVGHWNCNQLMMLSDAIAALSRVATLLLCFTNHLQVWQFYIASETNGIFSHIQELADSDSIAMMVPKQHYTRVSSMGLILHYGSSIFALVLAGVLYYVIELVRILFINLSTFGVAVLTVLRVYIPQPVVIKAHAQGQIRVWQEACVGFQYVFARPSLLALLVAALLVWFTYNLGCVLYVPIILARSNNNAAVLANLSAVARMGGVLGALLVSSRGELERKIHSFLLGMIEAGVGKTLFGLGQMSLIWLPVQLCSSLNFPSPGSSNNAIWSAKVEPNLQRRVFATRSLAMMPDGALARLFSGIFGTGSGAEMTLVHVSTAPGLVAVGIGSYFLQTLRNVEMLPTVDGTLFTKREIGCSMCEMNCV